MNKHKSLLLFSILIFIFFSGCASKTVRVSESFSILNSNKSKAYVVFAFAPPEIMGLFKEALLYEVNPRTGKQKLLINFDMHGKFVQEVTPGKHYYIIRQVTPMLAVQKDIKYQIIVNAKQEEVTYVELFSKRVFTPERKLLEKKLQTMSCTLENLHRYGFENSEGIIEGMYEGVFDTNSVKSYKSALLGNINISCMNDKVMNISASEASLLVPFTVATLNSMKHLTTVQSSESLDNYKLLDVNEIKNKHDIYHTLHKDAFQNYRFEIYNYSEKSNENKYGSIYTVVDLPENLDPGDISDIKEVIQDKFTQYRSSANAKELKIIFKVENYFTGDRLGRYAFLIVDNFAKSMASIQVSAEFVDMATGQKIGKVKVTRLLGIGFFGGSAQGLVEDAVDDIFNYAKSVYIKK